MKIIKIYGNYDGSQIKPLWAKENFNINEDNIVVMIGEMNVKFENMIDEEDLKNRKEIKGKECIHFLIEHYTNYDIAENLELAYYKQRLFVCCVEETLHKFLGNKFLCERKGDDIYIEKKKLSVSVATVGKYNNKGIQKIHFGINLSAEGTPADVEAIGLKELNFKEEDIEKFIDYVINLYINETEKIKKDIKKTKVFQ